MDTSTTNPFRIIVDKLSETPAPVTLEYLSWVNLVLQEHGIFLETYGEVFRVLEYLADAGVVELDSDNDCHVIKKVNNFGKNSF